MQSSAKSNFKDSKEDCSHPCRIEDSTGNETLQRAELTAVDWLCSPRYQSQSSNLKDPPDYSGKGHDATLNLRAEHKVICTPAH